MALFHLILINYQATISKQHLSHAQMKNISFWLCLKNLDNPMQQAATCKMMLPYWSMSGDLHFNSKANASQMPKP